MTECPKCGMMRLCRKVDSEPAKFCGGCGHSFANEEQTEKRIRELEIPNDELLARTESAERMAAYWADSLVNQSNRDADQIHLLQHRAEKAEAELARVRGDERCPQEIRVMLAGITDQAAKSQWLNVAFRLLKLHGEALKRYHANVQAAPEGKPPKEEK